MNPTPTEAAEVAQANIATPPVVAVDASAPIIVWRYPGADIDLAEGLGKIAAELWLAGKLRLD